MFKNFKFGLCFVFLGVVAVVSAADVQERQQAEHEKGEQLARMYCAMCHSFTEPDILPKNSWNFLLTYMGLRMGIDDFSYLEGASEAELDVIDARKLMLNISSLIPDQPMMSDEDWRALRSYYQHESLHEPLPQRERPPLSGDDSLFEAKKHRHFAPAAITSMVHIDEKNGQLLIGDSRAEKITILDDELNFVFDTSTRKSMWLQAEVTDEGVYLLSIGDISGDYIGKRYGSIFYGKRLGNTYQPRGKALPNLYRPADMAFGNLMGDGEDEVVVCNFGVETGDVSIYEKDDDGLSFKPEPIATLITAPGAVGCELHDFDGDGLLDVAVLLSDARERFMLYLNRGDSTFEEREILSKGPEFGYVRFELVDINQDGYMDFITVNGDNVDSDPYNTLKRYHGIRVYLNDGELNFTEAYFYPMYGAYDVEARDYDLDGDIDIAGIAFNPDFNSEAPENFVLLEQVGQSMTFVAKSNAATASGRWLTMDAGDLDGDGDDDIVLGGGYVPAGLSVSNPELLEEHYQKGPPLLFLENQTR